DILSGKFNIKRFNGTWRNDESIIYKDRSGFLLKYNVHENRADRLNIKEIQFHYVSYEVSADEQYVLLVKNYIKIFRHSFLAQYDILNLQTGIITELTINNKQEYLLMATWSPVGNALILNYDRNLYYKSSVFGKEIQLTNNQYFNGIPDWVYEEEVFNSNVAVWFSPDGNRIAFIQFDDSQTSLINIPIYGESGNMNFQYTKNRPIFYPKAGSKNPFVKLFYINLNDTHFLPYQIQAPEELNTSEYIITVVSWVNNYKILSIWMNRVQNMAIYYL
uniref:Dipeptidylpeptidase IV N-terminal domain-containing protein n=1 Tax=Megaselia scalaris TaxID=36166 RepID=T1GFX1_MEGSC